MSSLNTSLFVTRAVSTFRKKSGNQLSHDYFWSIALPNSIQLQWGSHKEAITWLLWHLLSNTQTSNFRTGMQICKYEHCNIEHGINLKRIKLNRNGNFHPLYWPRCLMTNSIHKYLTWQHVCKHIWKGTQSLFVVEHTTYGPESWQKENNSE